MENLDVQAIGTFLLELIKEHGPGLLMALVVLVVGLRVIKVLQRLIAKACAQSKLDAELQTFLANLAGWIFKVLLVVIVAGMVGMETASLVAVIGAAGLAVGLALQGTLANFAGGILVMLFKPFKIGDLVEMQGTQGFVRAIHIFNTILETPDSKTVIIPNGAIMNGNITNFTENGRIRVDLVIGIAYEADIDQAMELLRGVCEENELVLKDPAPFVDVIELADSSVNLVVRPYCKPEDYWSVYMTTTRKCKQALDRAGITIPFPQRDVHLVK
ncbi:MAG: mechanosensitive ion channel [Flavobacteriales bacterium]|nr:mechanosensitive ion channel [Flavobacteriales bacterium]